MFRPFASRTWRVISATFRTVALEYLAGKLSNRSLIAGSKEFRNGWLSWDKEYGLFWASREGPPVSCVAPSPKPPLEVNSQGT
jgi:hypothetical protein